MKATEQKDLAVVVVQTAASVNGYADSLSVLVRNGAKRTAPSTWPQALVVDHDVLRGAPDRSPRPSECARRPGDTVEAMGPAKQRGCPAEPLWPH